MRFVSITENANWLHTVPQTCTTPLHGERTVTPVGLAAGRYTGLRPPALSLQFTDRKGRSGWLSCIERGTPRPLFLA
jgi:hypothetical protein